MSTPESALGIDRPPEARVTQVGRWSYRVTVTHGLFVEYRDSVWGQRRAERVARRRLDRYVRRLALTSKWREESTVIMVVDDG